MKFPSTTDVFMINLCNGHLHLSHGRSEKTSYLVCLAAPPPPWCPPPASLSTYRGPGCLSTTSPVCPPPLLSVHHLSSVSTTLLSYHHPVSTPPPPGDNCVQRSCPAVAPGLGTQRRHPTVASSGYLGDHAGDDQRRNIGCSQDDHKMAIR